MGRFLYSTQAELPPPAQAKKPITLDVLECILSSSEVQGCPHIYAALCISYASLLRLSQFTVEGWPFDPTTQLTCGAVQFLPDLETASQVVITPPPFCSRHRVSIHLASADGFPTCPVSALKLLFTESPRSPDAPLFENADGSALSRQTFISTVGRALLASGLDPTLFGRCPRRGALLSARAVGLDTDSLSTLVGLDFDSGPLYHSVEAPVCEVHVPLELYQRATARST
ncbi:hypothetical protein HGRIS_006543 [Hohenbuehelia grisea]|uniref:Uncharacterized protein n=1 Tax=Hohenbuehelia grisea TaxID=104357 RepID=A0ABR3J9W8_9AGAR